MPDPLDEILGARKPADVPRETSADPLDELLGSGSAGGGAATVTEGAAPSASLATPAPASSTSRIGGWSALTPKTRRYARRLKIEVRRKERKLIREGGELPPAETHHGFFWMLDQLDRTGPATRNLLLAFQQGERNPLKLWDQTKKGLTHEERHEAIEIVDELSPKLQAAMYYPYMLAGLEPKTARAIINFGGDMGLDPLTFAGAGGEKGVVKIIGRARDILRKSAASPAGLDVLTELKRSANFWMTATGTRGKLPDLVRKMINRRSGIAQLDKLFASAIDTKDYVKSGLADDALTLMKDAGSVLDKHPGLITKLAEETNLQDAVDFAAAARSGKLTPQAIASTLEQVASGGVAEPNFTRFRNPGMIKKLIGLPQDEFDLATQAAQRTQALATKTEIMQQFEGRVVPQLGDALISDLVKNDRRLNATILKAVRKARKEQLQKLSRNLAVLRARKETVTQLMGKEKMAEVAKAMRQVAGTNPVAALRKGQIDKRALHRILRRYTDTLTPGFIAAMKKISKDRSAADKLMANFNTLVMRSVDPAHNPRVARLLEEQGRLLSDIERTPSWLPHVATAEAVEGLSKLPGEGHQVATWLRSPRTASDIHRHFAVKGRPISLEEIEHLYRTHQLTGASGAVPEMDGWIYKAGLGRSMKQTLLGKPREIAEFFDVDEKQVLGAMVDRTARSVTNARFMNDAAQIFGHEPGVVNALPPNVRKHFFRLGDLPATQQIAKAMPGLKNVYFADWQLKAITQRWERITNPEPVLKFVDGFGSWLKAYNLPMFVAYHTRNGIGNVLNMTLAGFMDLMSAPQDIAAAVKVGTLQVRSWKNDLQAMRGMKFFARAANKELAGDEFLDLAMRHGVVNSGWWGGELGPEFANALVSPLKKVSTWIPGSTNFIGIRGGHAAGRAMENHARLTLFASELQKGRNVQEAAATVKKFLGDFRSEIMTPFERQVLSRGFLFYRWSRYNIPLQLEQLVMNNKARVKMLAALRGVRSGQMAAGTEDVDVTDLPAEVPDWVRESAGVPVRRDPETGELTYWIWKNWHPAADLEDLMGVRNISRFLLLQSHPIPQKVAEYAIGRSFYFDQELEGHQTEFLGAERDAEAVNQLRMLRLISEVDRLDPLSDFHVRRELQDWKRRVILRAAGLTLVDVNPAQEQIRINDKRVKLLRERIAANRKIIKARKEEE